MKKLEYSVNIIINGIICFAIGCEKGFMTVSNKKKISLNILKFLCFGFCVVLLIVFCVIPSLKYNKAVELFESGSYSEAKTIFSENISFKESSCYVDYIDAALKFNNNEKFDAAISFGKISGFNDAKTRSFELWREITGNTLIDADSYFSVAIKKDGTVYVTPNSVYGENPKIGNWDNIISIAVCDTHIIGLKSDGTVVSSEYDGNKNDYRGQCDVSNWSDIVSIETSYAATVGLKSDGSVQITDDYYGNLDTSSWENIISISLYEGLLAGLKNDGTVLVTGTPTYGKKLNKSAIAGWKNIVNIEVSDSIVYGLKDDGTVVCSDSSFVNNWVNVTFIEANGDGLVGINNKGIVLGIDEEWSDISYICAGENHYIAVSNTGEIFTSGKNSHRQCDVDNWDDLKTSSLLYTGFVVQEEPDVYISEFDFWPRYQLNSTNDKPAGSQYKMWKGLNGTYTYRCQKECDENCKYCKRCDKGDAFEDRYRCTFQYQAKSDIGWIGCKLCGDVSTEEWDDWYEKALDESYD